MSSMMKVGLGLAALVAVATGCKDRKSKAGSAGESPGQEQHAGPVKGRDASAPTDADVPPLPLGAPTAASPKVKELVAAGRKAEPEQAVEHFTKARELAPKDPVVLSELSWALIRVGDYEQAAAVAQAGLEHANEAARKAALHFNRGVALEATARRDTAIEAYRKSVELRPHRGVSARLRALEARPEPAGELAAVKLSGRPELTLEAACKRRGWACKEVYELRRPLAPFKRVVAVVAGDENNGCPLMMETDKGWFAGPEATCYRPPIRGIPSWAEVGTALFAQKPGGALLRVVARSTGTERFLEQTSWTVTFCGVGASSIPACTEPMLLASDERMYEPSGDYSDSHMSRVVRNDEDGIVYLGAFQGGPHITASPSDQPDAGSYRLRFP
jgi:tetratricopeptide (TPR) repeat protein